MDLKDKVVFVTGSSRGIGAAIAKQFAKEKCNVILNDRKEVPSQLVEEITSYGVTCEVVLGDISKADDCKRMVKEIYVKFEQLDVLVNNAGITDDKLMIAMKEEDFRGVIDDKLSDKVKAEILTQIPLQRFGNTTEVAQAAVFLAQNDYMTGQVLSVDGGMGI